MREKKNYNNDMNVVITRFPYESQLGGMETMVLNLAKGLRAKGHTVSFVGTCPILLKMLEENNFKVTKLVLPRSPVTKGSLIFFILLYPFIWWQLRKIVKMLKEKDTVYMLSLTEKIVLTRMAYKKGLKVIWGEHESLQRGDGTYRKWLAKNPFLNRYRHLSRFATVVVVSHDLYRQFKDLRGVENLHLIENGIDTSFFTPSTKKFLELKDKFVVGTVARLKKEKGVLQCINVASRLVKKIQDIHFVIAGDGVEKGTLQHYVKDLQLNKYITFLGEVPHEKIREVYASFDVALFLSQEMETFGLTPLESMAMQRPTILTSAFGFLDGDAKTKLLVIEPHQIDRAVSLIEQIYNDESFRNLIKEESRRFVIKQFSLTGMVDRYEKIFLNPLSKVT